MYGEILRIDLTSEKISRRLYRKNYLEIRGGEGINDICCGTLFKSRHKV